MSLKPPSQDPNMQFKARLNDELAFRILITKGTEEVEDVPVSKPYKEMVRRSKRPLDEYQSEVVTEVGWFDIDGETRGLRYEDSNFSDPSIIYFGYADYYPLFLNDFLCCISWSRKLFPIHEFVTGLGTGDAKFQNGAWVYPVGVQTNPASMGVIFPSTLTGYNNNELTAQWGQYPYSGGSAGIRTAKYVVLGTPQIQVARPNSPDPVTGTPPRNFSGGCNMAGTMVGYSQSMPFGVGGNKYGVALKWESGNVNPFVIYPEMVGQSSRALCINAEGRIGGTVGYAAFWEGAEAFNAGVATVFEIDGTYTYLTDYNGQNGTGVLTSVTHIMSNGKMMGQCLMPGDFEEPTGWWYYDPDEDEVFLITVPEEWPYPVVNIRMRGLNEKGQAVGAVDFPAGMLIPPPGYTRIGVPPQRTQGGDPYGAKTQLYSTAVIWTLENGMIDINEFVAEDAGVYMTEGADINNNDGILCMGFYNDEDNIQFHEYNRGFIGVGVLNV